MRTLLYLAVYGACFTSKHACASPESIKPPQSLITPAPVLRRFADDFVGYALFTDGDTSIITCKTDRTYTYTDGYAGCVSTLGDLGTYCAGSTLFMTGGSSAVCSTACITDFLYYSLDDKYPAWGVKCATRTKGWKVLHMSETDLPSMSTDIITQTIDTSTPPTMKTVVITTSIIASTSTPPIPPPTQTSQPPKNNGALIGGAVAGSLVFLGLVIAGVFFFLIKRRQTPGFSERPAAQDSPFMGKEQPSSPYSPQTSPYVGVDRSQAVSPVPFSPPPASFSPPPASFSPPPASFSPPPEYRQDKSPSTTVSMVRNPVQQSEYGAGGEAYQAYGEPAHANELPAHYVQPQRRSELG